ncbi:MAG: hypothetical protein ACLUQ6_10630 [Alistipes onderdonkii]
MSASASRAGSAVHCVPASAATASPCGVAGEQLYQLQAASGDGLRQCFGKVSAADDHYAFQRSLHIVLQ